MKSKRPFLHLLLPLLAFTSTASAQQSRILVNQMLDCAVHGSGASWIPQEMRTGGVLRFTYLHQSQKARPGPYDFDDERKSIYVAFWNPAKTKAEFLDFTIDRSGSRPWLTISNEGQIDYTKGNLDFSFFQGGEWMRSHYLTRVRKLHAAAVHIVAVRDVQPTGVMCDSLADPHPEWDPSFKH